MDVEFRLKKLETENQRLQRAVEELSVLNDVAVAVSSASALDGIVDLIVQKCVKHLNVEQGALLLNQAEEAAPFRTMVRKTGSDFQGIPYRLGQQITGWMQKNQQPLLINDLEADGRFRLSAEVLSIRSLLCVPLRLKGQLIGVLSVFNKRGGEGFSEAEQRLLTIIAAQSAQVIENARLYAEEQALKSVEQELQTARLIQEKLLPKLPPEIPGYEIDGRSDPARLVGGDYFDFLATDDGRIGICLADVSGKGISASLLMANTQATIRSLSLIDSSVAERIGHSNRLLHRSTDSDKFVTMFYAVLDAGRHELRYSNAGHNPPFLLSVDGRIQRLEVGGPVLGVLPGFSYQEATVELAPGDVLLIFSDGCSEAMNEKLEEFSEERLAEIAFESLAAPPSQLVSRIFNEVQAFCGDEPQTDDMTAVALRRAIG